MLSQALKVIDDRDAWRNSVVDQSLDLLIRSLWLANLE
jgi:hypothetical protein